MKISKRACARLIAGLVLDLSFSGICASASQAAPLSARPVTLVTHARTPAAHPKRRFKRTASYAVRKLRVIATAYTAGCEGCSGITSTGKPAGRGIVAVDPHVIPLGTRLYVPGYGHALAGDRGGAIQGRRIDLGFDSPREARRYGRREIVVYVWRIRARSDIR